VYSRVRRPRAEGRQYGLAAARGEARQQPRRLCAASSCCAPLLPPSPEKPSSSIISTPSPGSLGRSDFSEGARRGRAACLPQQQQWPRVRRAFEAAAASAAAAAAATAALTAAVSVAAASRVDGIFSLVAARPSD
jgi:hypothetical protein